MKVTIDLADMDVEYFRTCAVSHERIINKALEASNFASEQLAYGASEDWDNHISEVEKMKLPISRLINALRSALFTEARGGD